MEGKFTKAIEKQCTNTLAISTVAVKIKCSCDRSGRQSRNMQEDMRILRPVGPG